MEKPKHVLLLGASVGKAWEIEGLSRRLGLKDYRFEYVGKYDFDKTDALKAILARKENRPDAVFIKECAAYFPGDLEKYKKLMDRLGQGMPGRRGGPHTDHRGPRDQG